MSPEDDTAHAAATRKTLNPRRKAAARIFSAALPPALLATLVALYGVDVPVLDQWSLIYDIDRFYNHNWTFSDLMRSHNGHRIFFSRIVFVSLAHLTGWNTRIEMALSVGISILTFMILWRSIASLLQSCDRSFPWHLLVLVSVAHFSLNQWENWLWGFQMTIFLNMFGTVGGLYLLSRIPLDWRKFSGAAALGAVATFSFGAGLSFWLVGACVLGVVCLDRARRRDLRFLWAWILLAGSVVFFYLWDLARGQLTSTFYATEHPLEFLYFVLTAVGSPVVSYGGSPWPPRDYGVAFGTGLLGVSLFVFILDFLLRKRRMDHRPMMHLLAIALYSLSGAGMMGLTRTSQGAASAMSSRYMTVTTPFWVCLIVLLQLAVWQLQRDRHERRADRLTTASRMALAALAGTIVLSSLHAIPIFANRHRILTPARAELASFEIDGLLRRLHPNVNQVRSGIGTLRRYRLSVFRDASEQPTPPARPKPLGTFGQLISLRSKLKKMSVGERVSVRVRVSNPTAETWPAEGDGFGAYSVRLAYHWFDANGQLVVGDGQRTVLPHDLLPGDSVILKAEILAPGKPGDHLLRLTMVQEAVSWFDDAGAVPADSWVRITARY